METILLILCHIGLLICAILFVILCKKYRNSKYAKIKRP